MFLIYFKTFKFHMAIRLKFCIYVKLNSYRIYHITFSECLTSLFGCKIIRRFYLIAWQWNHAFILSPRIYFQSDVQSSSCPLSSYISCIYIYQWQLLIHHNHILNVLASRLIPSYDCTLTDPSLLSYFNNSPFLTIILKQIKSVSHESRFSTLVTIAGAIPFFVLQ